MKGMKLFTLIFMLVCIITSIFILGGIPECTYALLVLVIVCSSLILPVLLCLVYIRGEVDELRLKKMIKMIKICMIYQFLIVPVFAAISSNYLLIITKMQYKHLIALNKGEEQ